MQDFGIRWNGCHLCLRLFFFFWWELPSTSLAEKKERKFSFFFPSVMWTSGQGAFLRGSILKKDHRDLMRLLDPTFSAITSGVCESFSWFYFCLLCFCCIFGWTCPLSFTLPSLHHPVDFALFSYLITICLCWAPHHLDEHFNSYHLLSIDCLNSLENWGLF